jgi:hypothetical protein
VDYDPFEQAHFSKDKAEPQGLGVFVSEVLSTQEFFSMKKYQVDQEIPEAINPLFNPNNYMFYIDIMGNLLSNQKLAFYEYKDEKNFISKMYQESYENNIREVLIRAYQIIREIYDDIATPVRQRQIRNNRDLYETDRMKALNIASVIANNRPLEETPCSFTNFHLLRSKDTNSHFQSYYLTQILSIESFKMSDSEYRNALTGLPVFDKALGHNT